MGATGPPAQLYHPTHIRKEDLAEVPEAVKRMLNDFFSPHEGIYYVRGSPHMYPVASCSLCVDPAVGVVVVATRPGQTR